MTRRIALGVQYRIPLFVWYALILISCIAMGVVGFQFGISGRRSLPANFPLALAFALVMQLIFDLDRPGYGAIQLNQRPMIDLYQSLSRQWQERAGPLDGRTNDSGGGYHEQRPFGCPGLLDTGITSRLIV